MDGRSNPEQSKPVGIVDIWEMVFAQARHLSMIDWFRRIWKWPNERDAVITERFVFGFTIAPFVLLGVTQSWIALSFGAFRLVSLGAYQVNVALFNQSAVRSYKRAVILAFHNYVEVIGWFALFYRALPSWFVGPHLSPQTYIGAVYYSVVTITTTGYGDIMPTRQLAAVVVMGEIALGVFLTLILFARVMTMLPKRGTEDPSEQTGGAQ